MFRGIQRSGIHFIKAPIGSVIDILAAFVFNRITLDFELFLRHGIQQKSHAVRLQPQHGFQLVTRHGLEIVGAIIIGRTVHGATGFGDNTKMLIIPDMLRALKHHVFKEMRKA